MYDIKFLFTGDAAAFTQTMIEWYVNRGRSCLGATDSKGIGYATLNGLEEIAQFARDMGITVLSAELVEEEEPVAA